MISLVLGLGNPGRKYDKTRHNVGFEVADLIAARFKRTFTQTSPDYLYASVTTENHPLLVVKPLTYMNLSGRVAASLSWRLNIAPEQILAIVDDLNLPFGKIRIRRDGSDGGHNGLKSIANLLETNNFPRLRVGVGPLPDNANQVDFVLSRFKPHESEPLKKSLEIAAESAIFMAAHRIDEAMSRYNN